MEKEPNSSNHLPGFDEVLALRQSYGSLQDIPDEELNSVGYYRALDGTVAPIGHEVALRTTSLETKNANKPFEAFSVQINTDKTPRILNDALIGHMDSIGYKIERLRDVTTKLEDFLSEEETQKIDSFIYGDLSVFGTRDNLEKDLRIEYFNDAFANFYLSDSNYQSEVMEIYETLISEIRAKDYGNEDADTVYKNLIFEFSESIERERGILTDTEEFYRRFDDSLGFSSSILDESFVQRVESIYYQDDEMKGKVRPKLNELVAAGLDTRGKLLLLSIGHYLDEKFPQENHSFVTETMNLGGSKEAISYINELEKRLQARAKKEFVAAKIRLRHTPYGAEGRNEAESALAKAKDAIKNTHQQLLPLLTLLDIPNRYRNKAKRYYDEMEEVLFASGSGERVYTFIADIDTERDANPGKVSGDCTENNPLPFLQPGNSLYNVKVIREDKHVGNVYLLEARDQDGKPIAWHLDAIQIPQYIDWSSAAPIMLDGFKQQALVRGVKAITINNGKSHISNYDYIADAFRKLVIREVRVGSKLEKLIGKAMNMDGKKPLQGDSRSGFLRLM